MNGSLFWERQGVTKEPLCLNCWYCHEPLFTMTSCCSGHDGSRAGLPAAPTHGLSHGAASADAGVLDEGEEPEAQVLTHRQHPGQAASQCCQPQGGDQHQLRVSPHPGPI